MRGRGRILIPSVVFGIVALSILDHAGLFGYRGQDRTRYDGAVATVVSIIDAETIEVDLKDGDEPTGTIHLRGIRIPKSRESEGTSALDPSEAATRFLRENIVQKRVRLALDPNRPPRDDTGHISAYVYLEDTGEMLNELLIRQGFADVDPQFEHVLQHRFRQLAKVSAKR